MALDGLRRKDFTVTSANMVTLEACPGAGVYVPTTRPKAHFAMWYGIFVHRFLEKCVTHGHELALEYIRTKKMKKAVACCEAIDPEQLYYGEVEIGYGHDPLDDTARRIPYSLMDTIDVEREQFGKADVLVSDPTMADGRPLIADYKCGEIKTPPSESTQLLGLAASHRAEVKCTEIDVALVGVRSNGDLEWHTQTVDTIDLDDYVDRAKRLQLRVVDDRRRADEGIQPEFVRGDQCSRCNSKSVCPAWLTT